jgi:hypothetical protein
MSPTQSVVRPDGRSTKAQRAAPQLETETSVAQDPERETGGPTGDPQFAADGLSDASKEQTLLRSALAVLIERAGGEIEFTEADYRAILASHGPHRLVGVVDSAEPGTPVVRMRIEASRHDG